MRWSIPLLFLSLNLLVAADEAKDGPDKAKPIRGPLVLL
jgi:hypothetical protein